MTSPSRETILDALFDKLKATYEFATASRRLQHWSKVSDFPALFVRHTHDEVQRQGIHSVTVMHVEVWVYTKREGDGPTDAQLNDLVDAIEGALAPEIGPIGRNTLDGLLPAGHCWIEGQTEFDPGDQDAEGRAKAIVPVLVLVP